MDSFSAIKKTVSWKIILKYRNVLMTLLNEKKVTKRLMTFTKKIIFMYRNKSLESPNANNMVGIFLCFGLYSLVFKARNFFGIP